MREEVTAFLIMEATGEPSKAENLQVFDKNGLFYLRFDTVLQTFDTLNRNRRIYESAPMAESLNAPHIQELIAENQWCGEAGHPDTEEVRRILTIDPARISHRITKTWIVGKTLYGTVETLDDDAYGTRFTKNILQGMTPAFSLRALASLIKGSDGIARVRSKAHLVAYDRVILPSHKEAYRDKSKPIQVVRGIDEKQIVSESAVNIAIPVVESQIESFIRDESKNVKMISNVYEVATESMAISKDMRFAIIKENGQKFAVRIEDQIRHEIRGFMSNI